MNMHSRHKQQFSTILYDIYAEFCKHTGIHGLRYIAEDGRRILERILWIIVAVICFVCAILLVSILWKRFSNSPTITTVETITYPIWRIPVPAVTLCNANLIFRSKVEVLIKKLFSDSHINMTVVRHHMATLGELIQPHSDSDHDTKQHIEEFKRFIPLNIKLHEIIKQLGQTCEDMLERCRWEGEMRKCSELFQQSRSYEGFCCSFNYRVLNNTSSPLYTRYYGPRMGLSVLVNPHIHDYFISSVLSEGVRVLLHEGEEYPDDKSNEKILSPEREMLFRITAKSQHCSPSVADVDPLIKDCVFENERRLKFFPVYSSRNCITECRMNHSLRNCNCVPFFYHFNENLQVCELDDMICLDQHYYNLHARRRSNTNSDDENNVPNNSSLQCDCPVVCNDVTYDIHASSSDFKAAKFQNSALLDGANVTSRSLFHFYFGGQYSMRMRRDIVSSWSDLLSSFGGIFNLFLGCSFVSAIELLYSFSLKVYLRMRSVHEVNPNATAEHIATITLREVHRDIVFRPYGRKNEDMRYVDY